MANENLTKLKTMLTTDKRFTGVSFATDSLDKIRQNINSMIDVMNSSRPGGQDVSSGNISGTTCTGFVNSKYTKSTISLKELEDFVTALPKEACTSVMAAACYCQGRIYINPCDCVNRTTCDCQTRTACDCNARTLACDCQGQCSCHHRIGATKCGSRCGCDGRDAALCGARSVCDVVDRNAYTCSGRTYQATCGCHGRCSCNTEKRFGG